MWNTDWEEPGRSKRHWPQPQALPIHLRCKYTERTRLWLEVIARQRRWLFLVLGEANTADNPEWASVHPYPLLWHNSSSTGPWACTLLRCRLVLDLVWVPLTLVFSFRSHCCYPTHQLDLFAPNPTILDDIMNPLIFNKSIQDCLFLLLRYHQEWRFFHLIYFFWFNTCLKK